MNKTVAEGETWLVSEPVELSELIVSPGANIVAPAGKLLTLTVNGVHRDLEPGTYTGKVVLSAVKSVDYGCENYGKIEWFHMNAAVSIHDGHYCGEESVQAAVQAGSAGDLCANGLKIRSEGDNFGGVYVDGQGTYEINDADIALHGNGGSDSVGYGAAISVRGNASVIINRAHIDNVGSIRTALQVCGHASVTVNDSELSARDNAKPNYVMAMSKAPWMLGIHGRVRTTNIQEHGSVTYHRCKVSAENWGAMSTDGTKCVRLSMFDSEISVTGSGYGAYSIGDCHDYFSHCHIRVPDYGAIQCSGALVTYTDETTLESGRIGVMMHGGGKPGRLTIDKESIFHTAGPAIQVKGRGADILIDHAKMHSDSGVLLQILENDDPNGRGMHMGPETVMDVPPGGFPGGGPGDPMLENEGGPGGHDAPGGPGGPDDHGGPAPMPQEEMFPVAAVLQNGSYSGDVFHCYSEKNDAHIMLSHADLTGRITTAVSSHPAGMPQSKEQYALIGEVEMFPCPKDTAFGLSVELKDGAVWTVSDLSYLTALTVGPDCVVKGDLTVNGIRTSLASGSYTGKLVLSPV